jgi:predicted RNA binding protein YcfA (HicA-like mRNA interferase family)
MKVRDILKVLSSEGWSTVRIRGSHRQLRHPEKEGTVTVAGKPSLQLPPGTLKSIVKQAKLDQKE